MPLDMPVGTTCFVDANILVYHFVGLGAVSAACRTFLGRVVRSEVESVSTRACHADTVQRVMVIEAQDRFKLGSSAAVWLMRHSRRIRELSAFRDAARQLDALPIRLLAGDSTILEAAEFSGQHGLLTNDVIIPALMWRHGLTQRSHMTMTSTPSPDLTVWKPRE